jgi:membrane fusion protein (multidrug efflux system)
MAKMGSPSDLKLTIYVSEKYSNDLKIGLPGYVSVLSIPDETFSVRISKLSPIVDKSKRTIEVSLDFVKPDKRLKAGMFAAVRLAIKQNSNTVVVPKSALSTYNAEDCVYVIQENKAVRKFVKTGLKNDTQIEITDGIQFGETVITAGSVTNGSAVRLSDSENSYNSDTAQKQ